MVAAKIVATFFVISKTFRTIAVQNKSNRAGDRPPSIRGADFLCLSLNTYDTHSGVYPRPDATMAEGNP
ncbi:MAG: hypothetical protein RSA53_11275, partial [Odoribacter sp.]